MREEKKPEEVTEAPKPEEADAVEPKREKEAKKGLLDFAFAKPEEKDKQTPKRGPGRPRGSGTKSNSVLKTGLMQQFTMVGIGVYAFNQYDGKIILDKQEDLTDSLIRLADQNPNVRKALEGLLVAGAWSGLAISVSAIAIPIMANHELAPVSMAKMMGAPDPRKPLEESSPDEK